MYADGGYHDRNPTLHVEDSAYKMRYLAQLLDTVDAATWPPAVRVLDVGGGAGVVGRLVCEWFLARGHEATCVAVDLSPEMLALQRRNNPHISRTHCGDLSTLDAGRFDVALLVDVVEHVPDCAAVARRVDALADWVLYNIPIERNLCDWLRDRYLRRRYYAAQTATLGHVHFFSPASATAFVRAHHALRAVRVPAFAAHVLGTDHPSYRRQRENPRRRVELVASVWIRRLLGVFAPWLIQGSLFMLARTRRT
jgi:SAM-dependent methyltransferase